MRMLKQKLVFSRSAAFAGVATPKAIIYCSIGRRNGLFRRYCNDFLLVIDPCAPHDKNLLSRVLLRRTHEIYFFCNDKARLLLGPFRVIHTRCFYASLAAPRHTTHLCTDNSSCRPRYKRSNKMITYTPEAPISWSIDPAPFVQFTFELLFGQHSQFY
jgi:hypothetical protein